MRRPVTAILSALITITKSPLCRCGVNVGLCFPRKICAICDATRPRTCPSASMTYHVGCRSAALALYVFIISLVNSKLLQDIQPVPDTAHGVGPLHQGASSAHVAQSRQIHPDRDAAVRPIKACQP